MNFPRKAVGHREFSVIKQLTSGDFQNFKLRDIAGKNILLSDSKISRYSTGLPRIREIGKVGNIPKKKY